MGETFDKQQYRNQTDHVIGVVALDHENKPKSIPVDPAATVWLNETERRLTANAPADPADNPFVNGNLSATGEERPTDLRAADIPLPQGDVGVINPEVVAEPSPPAGEQPAAPSPELAAAEGETAVGHFERAQEQRKAPVPVTASDAADQPEGGPAVEETAQVQTEEIGAAVEPSGQAPEGQYQAQEEVATPEAPAVTPQAETARDEDEDAPSGTTTSRER